VIDNGGMKKRRRLFVLVVFLLASAALVAVLPSFTPKPPGYYAVVNGMSRQEVRRALRKYPDTNSTDVESYLLEGGALEVYYGDGGLVVRKEFTTPPWWRWLVAIPMAH
jgi:hypothetical protein